jgi:hypothetical protein
MITALTSRPVTTARPTTRAAVVLAFHWARLAPTARLIQQEARVAVMTMAATRQPRRTARARSAGNASAFRHNDTWTRMKAVASGTKNIANE